MQEEPVEDDWVADQQGALRAGLVFDPPRRVPHASWRRAFLLQTVAVERGDPGSACDDVVADRL